MQHAAPTAFPGETKQNKAPTVTTEADPREHQPSPPRASLHLRGDGSKAHSADASSAHNSAASTDAPRGDGWPDDVVKTPIEAGLRAHGHAAWPLLLRVASQPMSHCETGQCQ